ncbi:uncharacterized protein PRCAT00001550001 [Priceomyces carsonii]|uniref:uncharacterized protein n=1 Tax=Priceomyces carsonii TaxID=28549 RepID=UPI002EDB0463|nr:unnamed protein product [Priceomyces carsonii]
MTSAGIAFQSTSVLSGYANTLAKELSSNGKSASKILSFQISLLEIFNHEAKKLKEFHYCDYEIAYVTYKSAVALYSDNENDVSAKTEDFVKAIRETLVRKRQDFESVKEFIILNQPQQSFKGDEEIDPLFERFNNLKTSNLGLKDQYGTKSSSSDEATPVSQEAFVETLKFREVIMPLELHDLLAGESKILLIDYRATKDFNHNHIKHDDVVNIDPSIVMSLDWKKQQGLTDLDLEDKLSFHLPKEQLERFKNRNRYELVVAYNFKFGYSSSANNRFDCLKSLLINEQAYGLVSQNPFEKLLELITSKNKYISSKLKNYPCYLAGGVFKWYECFGDKSIARTIVTSTLTRPDAIVSKNSGLSSSRSSSSDLRMNANSRSSSPYLKNFGEYLATAKSDGDSYNSKSAGSASLRLKFFPDDKVGDLPQIARNQSGPTIVQPQQQLKPSITRRMSRDLTDSKEIQSANGKLQTSPTKFLEQYTTGLTNLGNSCYMNCVLQCLGATPQLTKFFFPNISNSMLAPSSSLMSYRQHINVNNKLGSKGILTTNFVNLLLNMFNNAGKYFTPTSFKKVVGSLSSGHQFASFDQQDCIEFLNFLLDGLHEDLNQVMLNAEDKKSIMELTPEQEKTRETLPVRLASTIEWERYLKLNFSIVVDYFQGQYLSQLKCLECGHTSTTYNAFSILSLPIPEKLNSTPTVLLEDCLQEFVTTELLDEFNKWFCPNCKKFTKLTKKITITRLPQVLIIHFKRFKILPNGYINKLDTFVKYPVNEVLDLTSYWPDIGTSVNPSKDLSISKSKEAEILSTLPTRNQVPPFRYKLYGVVNHFGNLSTGHYTSYVHKNSDTRKKREWCYFDDAKITYNCSESQVLNKNAYCLFFQRI